MNALVETSDIHGDSPPDGAAGLPPTVVRLGWVSFLTDVSSEMIVPLLPAFLATLSGVPAMALGWIEGVAETTASFVKIVSGKLTDRARSKKPLVFLGYGLSSLARPLIGLAPSWPTVVLIRFVDRIGKGIRGAPRDTMIAAAVPASRRGAAYGLHRAFDNAGAVFGPLIAAGLVALAFSYKSIFLLAAIPAAASLLVLAFGVKEKPEEHEEILASEIQTGAEHHREISSNGNTEGFANARAASRGVASDARAHCLSDGASLRAKEEGAPRGAAPPSKLGSGALPSSLSKQISHGSLPPSFWRFASLIAFFTLSASSDTFLLLKAKEIGIAAAWLPVLWSFSNGVKSAFSTWGGGLSDRFGRRRLMLAAWTLYALCYAGFAFVKTALPLVVLLGVYSLYYSLSEGTERALVADLVPAESRGRAFGWLNGLTGFAALPASVGFGWIWQHHGSQAAFLTGAAIAATAAAGLLALRVPRVERAG